jgi:hypothetical protein
VRRSTINGDRKAATGDRRPERHRLLGRRQGGTDQLTVRCILDLDLVCTSDGVDRIFIEPDNDFADVKAIVTATVMV